MATYPGRDAAFRALVQRYLNALHEWEGNAAVKEVAGTIGLDRQEYCDRYIAHNYGPLIWASTGSNWDTGSAPLDKEAAYREALYLLAQEGQ